MMGTMVGILLAVRIVNEKKLLAADLAGYDDCRRRVRCRPVPVVWKRTTRKTRSISMRFARNVFIAAGIWGLLIVTPLYFLYETVGRQYPPPVTHPDFYYGFVSVTLTWQVAFLVIATDPIRFRPLIIAAVLEKFGYLATLSTLYIQGRLQFGQFAVVSPDAILMLLFVAAFIKTPARAAAAQPRALSV
jgi:hypothetical protein